MRLLAYKRYLVYWALLLVGCGKNDERQPTPESHQSNATQSPAPSNVKQPRKSRLTKTPITEELLPSLRRTFHEEIEGIIGRQIADLTSEEWRAIKQHYWTATLDQPIPQPKRRASRLAISDILAIAAKKDPLIIQFATGKFTDISDPAEQEFLVATHLLAMATAAQGGSSLPKAIADRINDPMITRGDLFMFEVLSDAFVEVTGRKQLSKSSKDQWQRLATCPNRLYRLLALRTFRRVEPEPKTWLAFYRGYLKDNDQEIVEEVISLVFQTALPEAAEVLTEFRAGCTEASPAAIVDSLDRSIEWMKRQPPATNQ